MKKLLLLCFVILLIANVANAELVQGIDIDFMTIGHAGNSGDTQEVTIGVGVGSSGYGSVAYDYRIGQYEITNAQWGVFTNTAGVPAGNLSGAYGTDAVYTSAQQPTNNVSWFEAVQFCNYLTTGDKSQGVYQFSGDNANPGNFIGIDRAAAQVTNDLIYFLPTEDEWYKAAYFKPDDSGYSFYANETSIDPINDVDSNYGAGGINIIPWDVGTGTQEQNGTYDMMGNVYEWNETLMDPYRGLRGGSFNSQVFGLASSYRDPGSPGSEVNIIGLRVASNIPEPATLTLLAFGSIALIRRNKNC